MNEIPENPGSSGLRAACYVRMSTDRQKYSIENQTKVITAYAAQREIEVVRSYTDEGRSGLTILKRRGLKELIADVETGQADFNCVLVYDVSRWGRFQDVDESAYYEFICRRAGINLHYCADEFENDGSLSSTILKSVKRVAAADYSRQLSRKVFLGHSHIASLGFWRGGPAGYGLRRQMLDASGKPKAILENGQQKWLKGDRVTLIPGPSAEQKIVRRIFGDFALKGKTRTEIANELNAEGIYNARGKPWQMQTINNVLRNEKYIGHNVYNRRSLKLQGKAIRNPPEMWIRCDNAFKPIVPAKLFAKAQATLAELENGRDLSDQELLNRLTEIWRKNGQLTMKIIQATGDIPHWTVFARRFGSIVNAYKLIGYEAKPRYRFKENGSKIRSVILDAAEAILSDLPKHGWSAEFLSELFLMTFNNRVTMVIAAAWSVSDGTLKGQKTRRWEVRQIKYKKSDLTLVIRLDAANAAVQDYFLLPTSNLPLTRDLKKLRISSRNFYGYRLEGFDNVLRALYARLHLPEQQLVLV